MSDILSILVPPASAASIATEAPQALALRPQVEMLTLVTPEDEQFAADVLSCVKTKISDLETQRKTITDPLNKAKRAVDELFRPAREAYEEIAGLIKKKLSEVETARRLAAARAADEAERVAMLSVPITKPIGVSYKPIGVSYPESWAVQNHDLRLVAQAVADGRLPTNFIRLDESAIKIWLRTYKSSTTLPPTPGLTIARVSSVRSIG